MNVLITGGCGFIGSNLTRHLLSRGHGVSVLDDLSVGILEDIGTTGATFVKGDVRDVNLCREVVRGNEVVVHLAAHTRVVESVKDPVLNFAVNGQGTVAVLEACRLENVERVVFASTGGAIVGDVRPPVTENMVPRPISPYGASKLTGEAYCSAYVGAYGLSIRSVRFSNVYGPYSYNKGSVVAKFIKLVQERRPITIFGDGKQTRDFVFVEDICRGIELAMDDLNSGFEVYNLGTGTETTINKLVDVLAMITSRGIRKRYERSRSGELLRNFVSIEKARSSLGFEPKVALSEGVRKTWDWFQSTRN